MSQQGELKKDYAYRRILEMILNDEVLEDHFPAEPEFCRQLGIARVTLRSAFKRLEKSASQASIHVCTSHNRSFFSIVLLPTEAPKPCPEPRTLLKAFRASYKNSLPFRQRDLFDPLPNIRTDTFDGRDVQYFLPYDLRMHSPQVW